MPAVLAARLRRDPAAAQARLGRAARAAAVSAGPVAIKLAQIVSYRSDLLPDPFLAPLRGLQAAVPVPRRLDVGARVARALGRPAETVLTDVEGPVAAGSIAVVCRARLTRDNRPVAVKLVRDRARLSVLRDLAALRRLMRAAARLPSLSDMPMLEVFDDVAAMIGRQCDMTAEARHAATLASAVADVPGLWVPQAIPAASGADLLTMDWAGHDSRFDDPALPDAVFETAADSLLEGLFRMIFVHGLVHCDLHPGNLLVDPDGGVAILDAGLVGHLRDTERRQFKHFFFAFSAGDGKTCGRLMLSMARNSPHDATRRAFVAEVAELVRARHGLPAGEFLIAEFVYRLFDLQRRHRLQGAPGFIGAILALGMYEGLVRGRLPRLDFQARARDFLSRHLVEMVQPAPPPEDAATAPRHAAG